ncbi:MAG: DUF4837 family protein [Paludibacteraceae bacterium]|nr:DUF4837 family protein [Paludibacteraceae bacterium]
MKRTIIYIIAAVCLILSGCKDSGRTLTSATGSIYEMLVVMDKPAWEGDGGALVKQTMGADMPCLPQMEPYFSLSQVSPALFDNFLKPTRNILQVDINPDRYTQVKVRYQTNVWSQPQAVCRVQSPSAEAFAEAFPAHAEQIRNWFVQQELVRQGRFYRNYKTTDTREAVQHRFGSDISVPADYILVRDTTALVWAVNDAGSLRRDLIVWSYPYTAPEQLSAEALIAKRNEVLGATISGSLPGTYMGTEFKHFPPIMTEKTVGSAWCAEIRGLWKMQGGEAMGGPFVQHTRIDEINQRIITAEVLIFAPGQKKRNALRQAEAILYTLRLPQELTLEEK